MLKVGDKVGEQEQAVSWGLALGITCGWLGNDSPVEEVLQQVLEYFLGT